MSLLLQLLLLNTLTRGPADTQRRWQQAGMAARGGLRTLALLLFYLFLTSLLWGTAHALFTHQWSTMAVEGITFAVLWWWRWRRLETRRTLR